MQKITTFLTFDNQAEEAANFYTSIFKNSKIIGTSYYGEGSPAPAGSVMTVHFQLEGQQFIALNAGPHFKFTEAISLMVNCENQQEIDVLWEKLTADGGAEINCGWLKDKYGLCWQIVPDMLFNMLNSKEPERVNRMMQAVMTMNKLDINVLKKAYDG